MRLGAACALVASAAAFSPSCCGVLQPAPAPRFSRTAPEIQAPPAFAGEHNDAVLTEWGFDAATIADLKAAGALVDAG